MELIDIKMKHLNLKANIKEYTLFAGYYVEIIHTILKLFLHVETPWRSGKRVGLCHRSK